GSRTAWMLDGSGDQLLSQDELAEAAEQAAACGLPMAIHAIGDGANRAALNALERTREAWEQALVRPRIEHVQCLDDADLPRFARSAPAAACCPAWPPTWWCWTPTSSSTRSGSPTRGWSRPCSRAAGCTAGRPGERLRARCSGSSRLPNRPLTDEAYGRRRAVLREGSGVDGAVAGIRVACHAPA